MGKSRLVLLLLVLFFFTVDCHAAERDQKAEASVTIAEMKEGMFFLASDYLNGRVPGKKGFEIAIRYLESQLQAVELERVFTDNNNSPVFLQEVPLIERIFSRFSLGIINKSGKQKVQPGHLFKVRLFDYGSQSMANQSLVFAGFGISDPEAGWDDLKGLRLRDKVVLLLADLHSESSRSLLTNELVEKYGDQRGLIKRLRTIANFKPAGILLAANDRMLNQWHNMPDYGRWAKVLLEENGNEYYAWIDIDLPRHFLIRTPLLQLRKELINTILQGQLYSPFKNGKFDPQGYSTFELKGSFISFDFQYKNRSLPSWNLAGKLTGTDRVLKDRYIVVGAHVDHFSSRNGDVMNGADDNASGCIGVLELAEALKIAAPRRSILFVFFTAEELGLYGSRYFVSNCPVDPNQIDLFVNLDMIGRTLSEQGNKKSHRLAGTFRKFPSLLSTIKEVNREMGELDLQVLTGLGLVKRSDQAYFFGKGIPTIGFFSGFHRDYHQPSDEVEKIDFDKMGRVVRLVYRTIMELDKKDSPMLSEVKTSQ